MEGPGDYSPLDRPRILTSGGRSSDNLTSSGFTDVSSGGGGAPTASVNDIPGRASTPTTLAAQYHSRYLHSAMPGSNFALMNSFLATGSPNTETRKTLVPELQHYWSVHAETFPRYLMARGLYPSYPPLFSTAPESLSLIGPGVACVPGSGNSAGPPTSMPGNHYQRLIEMQNEAAFLATVTASASHHHQALYGLGPNSIPPPFLDQPSSSSHASTPLSLVKQEPKEMSCAEKAAKSSERRSSSFKLDLEHAVVPGRSKDGHFLSAPRQESGGGGGGGSGHREQKSAVTSLMSTMTSGKTGDNNRTTGGYGAQFSTTATGNSGNGGDTSNHAHGHGYNVKKAASSSSSSSSAESGARQFQAYVSRKSASPAPNKDLVPKINNPHAHVVLGKKPSPKPPSNPRHYKAPTSASPSPLHSKELSASSSPDHSIIISIPTSIPAPIPLASVQHDGVVLAALASPSSAAAYSAVPTVKSVPPAKSGERSSHSSVGRLGAQDKSPKAWPEIIYPTHLASRTQSDAAAANRQHESEFTGERRVLTSSVNTGRSLLGSESPDVIVDSTDDTKTATSSSRHVTHSKYDKDRAIVETIERVAAATSDDDDNDEDDDDDAAEDVVGRGDNRIPWDVVASSSHSALTSQSLTDSKASSFSLMRHEPTTSTPRTVSAKTQQVSLAASSAGNIPVGIAVAQIRPQHVHHYEGETSSHAPATELRLPQGAEGESPNCLSSSVNTIQSSTPRDSSRLSLSSTRPESDVTSIVSDPPPPLAGRLPQADHVVNPSLWLQQLSLPIQTVNTAGTPYNPIRYPISAPSGFKFAHDPLTGQFYLIATGDASGASFQSNLSSPSAPLEEHRRRDRQSSRHAMGQNIPSLPLSDKALNARVISTLRKDGTKQQAVAQPFTTSDGNNSNSNSSNSNNNNNNNNSSIQSQLPPTSSSSSLTPHQHLLNAVSLAYHPVKTEKRTTQSRGCSPIIFDSHGKFLPSQSLSATFKRPQTCSVAVQTCDYFLNPSAKTESSKGDKYSSLRHQSNQTSSKTEPPHSVPALNPLSVHCPDIDPIPNNSKAASERLGYNPFTDPQILQAADGLELLSTLAEKRPKCSSYDDPKRIFPSPSDSFKSDTASILAPEDALSPTEGEMKSGQCTPRRDTRRDLSPKWTLPKKEPSASTSFGDFKAPTGLELVDPVEVRERLAEVQRRYKEKQKELAKLDSKKPDDAKASKRGPGRPPKKKTSTTRKSDDDSSSSSSKTKDGHTHKKKRPAEELVDRVFRKLPPVKPAKTSRSIHYVKSKTGPFFKRKPASSSSKRSRDVFGFDDKSWVSLHEGKHKKKYREEKRSKGKKKDSSSKTAEPLPWNKGKPTGGVKGAMISNVENAKSHENTERRGRPSKAQWPKNGKESVKSVSIVTVKSEPSVIVCDRGLGRLGKISFTSTQPSSSTPSLITTSLTSSTTSSISTTSSSTTTTSVSNTTTTVTISSIAGNSACSLFTSTNPSVTFGSMSSIMQRSEPSRVTSNSSSSTTTTSSTTATTNSNNSRPLITTPTTSLSTSSSSMPSLFSFDDSSFLNNDNANQGLKRKGDEDSDTDTSDTSPNKKRKPGRPRKINPDMSAGGTETIWAKKSSSLSLLQIPDARSAHKDMDNKMKMELNSSVMKPLFLDEEWCRRRSERIFLSEPSPQPSPSPRAEPVWKLSNFMPKNTKMSLEPAKDGKEDEKDHHSSDSSKEQEKAPDISSQHQVKNSLGDEPTPQKQTLSMDTPPSTKGKKGPKGKGKAEEKDLPKPVSSRDETSTPSPTPSMKKAKRAQEHTKMKHQKAKSLHDLTQKVKKKYSKGQNKKAADEKKTGNKKGKTRKSGSESSDTDNAPLSSSQNRPITPEPQSAVITADNLKDGLRVLYLNDGLFYEGVVKAIQPPDVYGVLTAGQRGNRPHILCQEEILRDAVVDVKPGSIRHLPEGARICAFWSQQFSCLYPGTIAKTSPNPHVHTIVSVEFDDGDSGRIPVNHVRLLPPDFPIIEYEPDPLESLPKRRKRTAPSKTPTTDSKSPKKSRAVSKEDDDDEEKEKSDEESDSVDSDDSDDGQMWKWAGKSTKRLGLKGRAKKEFYKSIVRGKETIIVGDSAVFVSTGRVNCPYIGRVESLWESWGGQKMVRVSWFYHPEETKGGKRLADTKNALFESPHGDENDVQTISHKCEVLSHAAYKRRLNEANRKGQSMGPNVFYLAGYYDPTVSLVKFEPGVL